MNQFKFWSPEQFVSKTVRLIGRLPELSGASSEEVGITACRWTHPPHESNVPRMDAYFLAYHFGSPAHVGYRADGGKLQSAWCEPGTCTVVSPGIPMNWNLFNGMQVINVLVSARLVARAEQHTRELRQGSRKDSALQIGFRNTALQRTCIRLVQALRREDGFSLEAETIAQQLCLHLAGAETGQSDSVSHRKPSLTAVQVKRTIEYMRANLHRPCSLSTLSEVSGVSVFQFAHAFKYSVGIPPHQYLNHLRLSEALLLLGISSVPISYVGVSVGFHNAAGFANFFRRSTGVSPLTYRQTFGR